MLILTNVRSTRKAPRLQRLVKILKHFYPITNSKPLDLNQKLNQRSLSTSMKKNMTVRESLKISFLK